MSTQNIPFQTIDWSMVPITEQKGERGVAYSKTTQFQGLQIRIVEYSGGYAADHWCDKGHIVYCLEGELIIELKDDINYKLTEGMMFVISDELSSHRLVSETKVKVLIIDGDFLKYRAE